MMQHTDPATVTVTDPPPAPIRFGVVGTGWISRDFVTAGLAEPGFRFAAVCSRSESSGRAFIDQFATTGEGPATWYPSVEALAAADDIDAVYVASPNALHAPQSEILLAAGKHVLCEKPLASNAAEARRVMSVAAAAGRLYVEAYMTPHLPNFAALREALPEVGAVRRMVTVKCQYSARYDKVREGEVPNVFDPQMAGGALVDLGIYAVAPAIYLFGPPATVRASGTLLPTGVDGQGTVILGYPGTDTEPDFEAVCIYSKIAESGLVNEVQGALGTVLFDDASVPASVEVHLRSQRWRAASRAHVAMHMQPEIASFMAAVRAGSTESPVNTHALSLAVLDVLDEARRQLGVVYPADRV